MWKSISHLLKRKIYDNLKIWTKKKDKKCLVVQGARQTGKTYIIEQFAKEYTNPKGVLGLRWKEGEEITKPFAARPNADHTNNDNKLQFYSM